jgi:hypothetical protein
VLDPGEDPSRDFDDLCVAELSLKEVLDTPSHFITSMVPFYVARHLFG